MEQAQLARAHLLGAMQKIKNQMSMYYDVFSSPNGGAIKAAYDMIKMQGEIRKEYYKLYISPDLPKYIHLVEYLEKNVREFPAVCLSEFSLDNKVLHAVIKDFLVPKELQGVGGQVSMNLVVKDQNNNILYNQNKSLMSTKDSVTISIPLEWLKQGEYFIIGNVTDLLTGKGDIKLIQPLIR